MTCVLCSKMVCVDYSRPGVKPRFCSDACRKKYHYITRIRPARQAKSKERRDALGQSTD